MRARVPYTMATLPPPLVCRGPGARGPRVFSAVDRRPTDPAMDALGPLSDADLDCVVAAFWKKYAPLVDRTALPRRGRVFRGDALIAEGLDDVAHLLLGQARAIANGVIAPRNVSPDKWGSGQIWAVETPRPAAGCRGRGVVAETPDDVDMEDADEDGHGVQPRGCVSKALLPSQHSEVFPCAARLALLPLFGHVDLGAGCAAGAAACVQADGDGDGDDDDCHEVDDAASESILKHLPPRRPDAPGSEDSRVDRVAAACVKGNGDGGGGDDDDCDDGDDAASESILKHLPPRRTDIVRRGARCSEDSRVDRVAAPVPNVVAMEVDRDDDEDADIVHGDKSRAGSGKAGSSTGHGRAEPRWINTRAVVVPAFEWGVLLKQCVDLRAPLFDPCTPERVVAFSDAKEPPYAYKHAPVRDKAGRRKLNGYTCDYCVPFYRSLPKKEQARAVKLYSRHRGKFPPPYDPQEIWEVNMDRYQEPPTLIGSPLKTRERRRQLREEAESRRAKVNP